MQQSNVSKPGGHILNLGHTLKKEDPVFGKQDLHAVGFGYIKSLTVLNSKERLWKKKCLYTRLYKRQPLK